METYPGAFAGIRLFNYSLAPPRLMSWSNPYNWKVHETNRAQCMRRGTYHSNQRSPVRDCNCGFWFFKDLAALRKEIAITFRQPFVMSLCAGWGKYVEHEYGFRAEFARPLALIVPPLDQPRTWKVAELYEEVLVKLERLSKELDLPLILEDEIPAAIAEFGLDTLVNEGLHAVTDDLNALYMKITGPIFLPAE